MAGSSSRPDAGSPAQVAGASFPSVRKGYDPDAVQRFLREVASALQRAHDRIDELEHRLRSAPAASAAPTIDEDTATRLLGEEAARILQTAREASQQIRAKAEEAAGRLVREASDDAARLREEAELEAARRRADASADAEAELEMAKQQGREMVTEAREYRERVLADVARRRELARQQVEQLVHGRERLVQAFERARLAAVDVVASLAPVTTDAEFVDLEPTTGPVPVTSEQPEPEPEPEPASGPDVTHVADVVPEPAEQPSGLSLVPDDRVVQLPTRLAAVEEADDAPEETPAEAAADEPAADEPTAGDDDAERAPVVALFAGEVDAPPASGDVDDLFAKLRAASAEMVAREASAPESQAAPEPEPGAAADSPFAQRDEALVPIIVATSRKMKRVLAEEQNSLFDAVRRHGGKRQVLADLDALLPGHEEHVELYRAAVDDQLQLAALAGAGSQSTKAASTLKRAVSEAAVLAPVVDALSTEVVGPLRARLEHCHQEAAGDADVFVGLARSAYREWKSEHIDEHVDDLVQLAYGRGAFAAIAPKARVCWLVDPNGPACPDAEDNALAGAVAKGETFPTGHAHPPAHAGCRCLLGVASE